MKLAIDADPIGRSGSGNETYLRGMIGGLQRVLPPSDALILSGSIASALHPLADHRTTVIPARPGLRGDLAMGAGFRRAGADVAVGHYNAPFGFPGAVATVVHDVAFLRLPDTFPRGIRARLRWSVARSVRRSDLIITDSEFSRQELLDAYPRLVPEHVVITPCAAGEEFQKERTGQQLREVATKFSLPKEFVLAVGNLQPRKNLVRLATAASQIGVPLVAVGQRLWRTQEVDRVFADNAVIWLGRVSDDDLAALYRLCSVFAYPSLYEGFGLPVLEAMTCGAAVVTSDCSSLPEVAGDAALLVDPLSVESIEDGLRELLGNDKRRSDLARSAVLRAQTFSWDASARILAAALAALADRH